MQHDGSDIRLRLWITLGVLLLRVIHSLNRSLNIRGRVGA
jgi:hypothetical protein